MMTPVGKFLARAGVPPLNRTTDLTNVAKRTALRRKSDGTYYLSNLRRGDLLYALIARLRPRVVLEIGTGRGYGALCMAMAAVDTGTDTTIISVDQIPPQVEQDWPIDEGDGPTTVRRSVRQVWSQLPEVWTRRITLRTGSSTDVMREWLADPHAPTVDFAFIDGGHDFWTARHDVMTALMAGRGASVSLLLDDYGGVQGKAVRRFVDGTLAPRLPDAAIHRLEMPQSPDEFEDNGEHGMVFIDGQLALVNAERFGWAARRSSSTARFAANVEAASWRARAATVRGLRRLGVRR